MELNEIKKSLYKENPPATLDMVRKGHAHFTTQLSNGVTLIFDVPLDDMGDATFFSTMDSKLLIRWICQ
jgi:hypothetical protein